MLPGASNPLTGGGKCLLEKVGGKVKIKNWRNIFGGRFPRNT